MFILSIILAGVLGTTAMILLMGLMHGLNLANADMVRAIGSFYTQSYKKSLVPGLIINYFFGIIFSLGYAALIGMAPETGPSVTLALATAIGFVHGIVIGLFLITEVTEFHPLVRFRKAGPEISFAYILGHIGYGLTVGVTLALTGIRLPEFWASSSQSLNEIITSNASGLVLFGITALLTEFVIFEVITHIAPHSTEKKGETIL
jgi:hypothetical protein